MPRKLRKVCKKGIGNANHVKKEMVKAVKGGHVAKRLRIC
jgi:hypothetical protein